MADHVCADVRGRAARIPGRRASTSLRARLVPGIAITKRTGLSNESARTDRFRWAARSCAWKSTSARSTSTWSISRAPMRSRSAARESPAATGASIRACHDSCALETIRCTATNCPLSRRLTERAGNSRSERSWPTANARPQASRQSAARRPRSTRLTNDWLTPASSARRDWVSPAVTRATRSSVPKRRTRNSARLRPSHACRVRRVVMRRRVAVAGYRRISSQLPPSARQPVTPPSTSPSSRRKRRRSTL